VREEWLVVVSSAVLDWLLDSDASVRFQAMRDLTDAPADELRRQRERIAVEGWGARLLDAQTPDGWWGGDGPGDRWRYALYTLHLLQQLGVDPAHPRVRAAVEKTRDAVNWGAEFGDSPFFDGEEEPCINGRALLIGAYFGVASESLYRRLLDEQLDDGGWNCDAPRSVRGSFHTTICVLEGLREFERGREASDARREGEEYLLRRGLLSTGGLIDRRFTTFSFPDGSDFDVLRGLDYLRAAGRRPDGRAREVVEVVRSRRQADGRWPVVDPGLSHQHVVTETSADDGSRWNTLRALRVSEWAG
jgi:hypothetical protein